MELDITAIKAGDKFAVLGYAEGKLQLLHNTTPTEIDINKFGNAFCFPITTARVIHATGLYPRGFIVSKIIGENTIIASEGVYYNIKNN